MASQGPNNPSNTSSFGTGDVAWTDSANITTENGVVASANVMMGFTSKSLGATNFGFTVPGGATIDGIEVGVKRRDTSNDIADFEVKLVVGGVLTGNNKADTVTAWPPTLQYTSYGGASDLWGTTLSESDVNSTQFGVALRVSPLATGGTAEVDHIRMTVHYTEGGGGGSGSVQRSVTIACSVQTHPALFEE